jgi:hypothetical protein
VAEKKTITRQNILGQRGINLIERRVLEMGFAWHPSNASLDAGIDGIIELRDPTSGVALNLILQVQSKERSHFQADTEEGFEYTCDERDLNYWLRGNAPVLLIVNRPTTDEAYWISVKDQFRDAAARESRRARFDKKRARFDASARDALLRLAAPADSGLYLAPTPITEALHANLLKVAAYPDTLHAASTRCRKPVDVWHALGADAGQAGGEWALHGGQILSFRPLREPPWSKVCDQRTVRAQDAADWALSDDPDRRRQFVRLLNLCLRAKCRSQGLRYHAELGYHFFPATQDLSPRKHAYRSLQRDTDRTVFEAYLRKGTEEVRFCRHRAFEGRFVRYGEDWYLEISPTYLFTRDGKEQACFHAENLSAIKRFEGNRAVLGQVVMWLAFLTEQTTLFQAAYPYLTFAKLSPFPIDCGLDDNDWLTRDKEMQAVVAAEEAGACPLFE